MMGIFTSIDLSHATLSPADVPRGYDRDHLQAELTSRLVSLQSLRLAELVYHHVYEAAIAHALSAWMAHDQLVHETIVSVLRTILVEGREEAGVYERARSEAHRDAHPSGA